jgi:hypothetical protein
MPLQYLGESTIPFFYDVGVFAFPYWVNPEHWFHDPLNARKNCSLANSSNFEEGVLFIPFFQ